MNRTSWPSDDPSSIESYYGKHSLNASGKPTKEWEAEYITSIKPPYRMTTSWTPRGVVRNVRCHKKVASSLQNIFSGILAHYGSEAEVKKHRMHLFGGCYEYRNVRGGSKLSLHSWGIAVDLDTERNPQGKPWNANDGMMPMEVVAIFKEEGWKWGGEFQKVDCMHFEATS